MNRVKVFPVISLLRARAPKALPVALALAAMGHRLTQIPQGGKHPWRKGWTCNATSDTKLIETWDGHWPAMNWGVLCGREGGVFVLDADGLRGVADLARLEAELGPLPPTWRVRSGRADAGEHVWLAPPPGADDVRNQQPLPGYKVDVRGWHGQTVIPGSLHKSGRRYEWLPGCAPGEIELAVCPDAWWAWLPKKEAAPLTRPSARHARGIVKRKAHDPASGIIGDSEGAGGFNRPIRVRCCQFWAHGGTDDRVAEFREVLRETILNADNSAHTPEQIARYASAEYLDAELASARDWINRQA